MKIYLKIPEICPYCETKLKIEENNDTKNLVCPNNNCEMRLINRLDHFAGKKGLDIKGLSKATLEKLIDWGWVESIKDLYNLYIHEKEWISKPGFGEKSVQNILSAIENSKNCELSSFICALGIPLIGSTYAKELSKIKKSWEQIRNDIKVHWDFTKIDGFGPEICAAILNFDYTEADYLAFNILNIKEVSKEEVASKSLEGINIVITGKLNNYKNRAELQGDIEKLGGKVVSSVSKNTTYLINNDNTSTSSKNLGAQKLGIPILTEEEFIKKFL